VNGSGQFHIPAALTHENKPWYSTAQGSGQASEMFWTWDLTEKA